MAPPVLIRLNSPLPMILWLRAWSQRSLRRSHLTLVVTTEAAMAVSYDAKRSSCSLSMDDAAAYVAELESYLRATGSLDYDGNIDSDKIISTEFVDRAASCRAQQ